MQRLHSLGLFSVLSLTLSCGVDTREPITGRASQSIVNGQNDSGHPAIVALTIQGQAFCTGTLVTPEVVVTAAHCIHPSTGVPANQTDIFFGDALNGDGFTVPVAEGRYHPDWYLDDPEGDDDVAVLRLSETVDVVPMAIGKTPAVGSILTLIGFGITQKDGGNGGTKRITEATIIDRVAKVIAMEFGPGATCNGDSGGPALFTEDGVLKLVGIHSRSDCETYMLDERVDAHDDNFIFPFINEGATCAEDGACAVDCGTADPDCPCLSDGYCVIECTTPAIDPDCDPACDADGTCVEMCPRPDPDCGPVCVADGTCVMECGASMPDPDCDECAGEGGCGGGGSGGSSNEDDGSEDMTSSCGCEIPGRRSANSGEIIALAAAVTMWRLRRRSLRRQQVRCDA
jgi:hypothetical protein